MQWQFHELKIKINHGFSPMKFTVFTLRLRPHAMIFRVPALGI